MARRCILRYSMVLVAFGLLAASAASAQVTRQQVVSGTTQRIQARTYHFEAAGREMPYEIYVPTSYDSATAMPLIIVLHGLGSTPRQVIRYQGLTDQAEQRGYIVAAPMGYNERGWYGSRGAGDGGRVGALLGRGAGEDSPPNLGELSEKDVMNVLGIVQTEFNIDPKRIYLMGHSMGGAGTWHLGIKHPDLWAALAPVAPAMFTSPDPLRAITHIPVIVIQGENDNLVPVAGVRRWVERMRELGMTYRYIEIPGGDHAAIIARSPENMGHIFDFFDQHRRN